MTEKFWCVCLKTCCDSPEIEETRKPAYDENGEFDFIYCLCLNCKWKCWDEGIFHGKISPEGKHV